jgi:penicillin-insensitive murein endopeptidase
MIFCLAAWPALSDGSRESTCHGTTENGRLENGWKLPVKGANFQPYSRLGAGLGRTYVHSKVYRVVTEAYAQLAKIRPGTVYVYGETGAREGGRFRPHKTHQNGLSVDFMVPVVDRNGRSVPLPASLLNKFGYGIEFSNASAYENYNIDFDAVADHLVELRKAADANGIGIMRVIFDNEMQKKLFDTKQGEKLIHLMKFSTRKPWVRHDEHYHVDFAVSCGK